MDALCEGVTLSAKDASQVEDVAQPNPKPKHTGKATNDLPNLDLLRSVAVGLVFFTHLAGDLSKATLQCGRVRPLSSQLWRHPHHDLLHSNASTFRWNRIREPVVCVGTLPGLQ